MIVKKKSFILIKNKFKNKFNNKVKIFFIKKKKFKYKKKKLRYKFFKRKKKKKIKKLLRLNLIYMLNNYSKCHPYYRILLVKYLTLQKKKKKKFLINF